MENEKLDQLIADREMYEEYSNEPIPMEYKGVLDLPYDKKQFKTGIDSMSYVSGQITALLNTGISEEVVLAILQMENNKIALEKQFEVEKEITKITAASTEMKEL